jgi:hypothetical protein
VANCGLDEMARQTAGIPTTSHTDFGRICIEMQRTFGAPPPTMLLRAVGKSVAVMRSSGVSGSDVELGRQLIQIAVDRGQTNPQDIYRTIDLATRIATGVGISPNELHKFLQQSGPMAKTLSDDGIVSMTTVMRSQ